MEMLVAVGFYSASEGKTVTGVKAACYVLNIKGNDKNILLGKNFL